MKETPSVQASCQRQAHHSRSRLYHPNSGSTRANLIERRCPCACHTLITTLGPKDAHYPMQLNCAGVCMRI